MSDLIPAGYYRDHQGDLQRDRRNIQVDRRKNSDSFHDDNRRNLMRRKSDRLHEDREHSQMIEDALEDFASQHQE